MTHARNNRKLIPATLAAIAVTAAPALAAAPEDAGDVSSRDGVGAIAEWIADSKLRTPSPGPFLPIVGEVDYGTPENAFGAARSGHVHAGQDMFAAAGTPLVAVTDSTVVDVGSDGGQGNYVHLHDPRRELTYVYMHMVAPSPLRAGERVRAGEGVGAVGCTGSCWGDHLHFEVRRGKGFAGEARDPLPLLQEWRTLTRPR